VHGECVVHTHPVPPGELDRYSINSDPHSEMDIATYVEGQATTKGVSVAFLFEPPCHVAHALNLRGCRIRQPA
jgi:hypothetical protein